MPEDLSSLDGFFSIGVNRILYHYDPTVVMWFDYDVLPDIKEHLRTAKAIPIVQQDHNNGNRWHGLEMRGHSHDPIFKPLDTPWELPWTGSSAVTAAFWAIALGCGPIYLLGMGGQIVNGKSNSYGKNRHHSRVSLPRIQRATAALLKYDDVVAVADSEALAQCVARHCDCRKGREYYAGRLTSFYRWQQPEVAG